LVHRVARIAGAGSGVVGLIVDGSVRAGLRTRPLDLASEPVQLTVAVVDYIDDPRERRAYIGLMFRENRDLAELRQALPAGSLLELVEPAPDRACGPGR